MLRLRLFILVNPAKNSGFYITVAPDALGPEQRRLNYMALTRKSLKAMGLTDEQVDSIIEMHSETVDALKEQRDQYKADAEKLPEIQKQLDTANHQLESAGKDSWKVKYDALKEDFDAYKADQTAKETRSAKEKAYTELLKSAGIPDKRIAAVLKVSDLDSLELEDNGSVKDSEKITESIKTEWADFIPTTTQVGPTTPNPPENNPAKTYTRDDIRKMTPAEINQNFDAIKASLRGAN